MLLLSALVVGLGNAWADDPEFEFNFNELYQNGSKVTSKTVIGTSGGTLTFTDEDENFTILLTRNSGNQPGFYTSSGYFRFYSSDTFKLTAASGISISKVVITPNGSNFSLSSMSGLNTSTKTWTGPASEVTFTGSGTNKWDKITITYTSSGGGKTACVDASTITLEPGDFDIKGHRTGTFVADGTKADAGATFSYSTTATSGLIVESDGSYTASAAGSYTVKVTATPSNEETYSIVTKNFDLTLTDTRSASGLAYETSKYDANLGEDFDTPTLTNPNSLSVTYSSSPASVATVNASTGAVTLLKEGTVTITANGLGTNDYKDGSASYTITVTDPNKKVFNFEQNTEDYDSGVTTTTNSSTYVETKKTWKLDGVTIDTEGKYRWWDSSGSYTLRFYSTSPQSKMTISAPTGKVITGIVITGGLQFSSNVGTYSSSKGKWEGQATSVVLTYAAASGSVNVKTVTVYIGDPTVTVGAALYTTYTTLVPVSFAGVNAYTVSSISGDAVSLTKVTEAPVNTPVIIEAGAADTYTLTYKSDASSVGTNLLGASDGTVEGDGSSIYALGVGKTGANKDKVGFYLVDDGVTIPAGKAYLDLSGSPVKEFLTFDFGDDPDGIETVDNRQQTTDNSPIYNLAGQRISKMQKGINIINGKKVLR